MNDSLYKYLALWSVSGIGSVTARKIISYAGGIDNILKLKESDFNKVPGIGKKVINSYKSGEHLQRADDVIKFSEKFGIKITSYFDDDYPFRLKQCEDGPLILFTKGQPITTERKYISIVGTRESTTRGNEFCDKLISDFKERGHDVVIVSGLAFGIDIAAHKASLKHGLSTIGVLAHGLDTIYPAAHRQTAAKMIETGTLVTEFLPEQFADKGNFVRRNRIIAGLCDALIVIESKSRGGALISADLAISYNRDVFAVPGRITDKVSEGCNKLIKINKAALLERVEDIEYILGWDTKKTPIQKKLFYNASPDEQTILDLIPEGEEVNIDIISQNTDIHISKISALLLNLEFEGLVNSLPGKVYSKS